MKTALLLEPGIKTDWFY